MFVQWLIGVMFFAFLWLNADAELDLDSMAIVAPKPVAGFFEFVRVLGMQNRGDSQAHVDQHIWIRPMQRSDKQITADKKEE